MPKRTDIRSIAIIGAGPIVIGQACEFDYSGAQACKALRAEGYRVVLVNSNPATIMTDPELADATYIEPITPATVARILERERPDALLPTMGGQTALNTAIALAEDGTLERLGIEMIGADKDVIAKAEDRQKFREAMDSIGLDSPRSRLVSDFNQATDALEYVGLPAIIRPSYTLGGAGGGIAYNREEYENIVRNGLRLSPVHQVLIEESVLGWKEYEMEVVRDRADNCIIICAIENIDPMGVHTGDSITVAPALTLTDKEYQIMRSASIAVLREIGVDTGGSNVQFAVDPETGRLVVIEMNPRVSRSSALASKATGFPIAKVAAKLAVGYTLDELTNDITRVTPASFEPTIDYVVTKIPRFTFEKFAGAEPMLNTSMKSVGEAMAIGRSFSESFQKALRSLETGWTGLNEIAIEGLDDGAPVKDLNPVRAALSRPTPDRILVIAQALRLGMSPAEITSICKYDPWFVDRINEIVTAEADLKKNGLPESRGDWLDLKMMGFADARLGELVGMDERAVSAVRRARDVTPIYKRIDTCAGEFSTPTSYMYSCYEPDDGNPPDCESLPTDRRKIIILGGGPNRIGQGIEFDYCCVHAAYALKEAGYETIMVNCNPETVSTDYDTSDRLYFEPLTTEDVIEIVRTEQRNGALLGVIVQFGGQTPLKLAGDLEAAGIPILGTPKDAIDRAEDRERFADMLNDIGLRQPANGLARSAEEAERIAERLGYPLLLRPSYVLGGRAMEVIHNREELRRYITTAVIVSGRNPVLIDSYLQDAVEVDVDAVSDGSDVYVAGIMEHIEEAGIHSGDSACALPPHSLTDAVMAAIEDQTRLLAKELGVVGLMNVQFAIKTPEGGPENGPAEIYIIEVNPRASRTVPFVAKATGTPIAKIAARIMAGEPLSTFRDQKLLLGHRPPHVAVKEAVFPFARFPGVDTLLGPEMKSTGEVMGLDRSFGRAFLKSQLGAGVTLPREGRAFLSVRNRDKANLEPIARGLAALGFTLVATRGTQAFLASHGLTVTTVNKVLEGQPHIVDEMKNGVIDLVINTTDSAQAVRDSMGLRRTALVNTIPYYTTIAGARAAVEAIAALKEGELEVEALQSYVFGS
ncbi:carbamoyl-phosphate synthase large subunit [Fodinicurvata sp. EGI_FJ10296]|uniref:carbamoyl-phosphate synthase large subunit n=1 Tax=Fodinicurvata sp. EGI_FJ10296 TaxID=3231908 RepID=UPI003454AE68